MKRLSILAATILLTACGSKTTEEYISNAQQLINHKDYQAAQIELKNAVSDAPEHAQARLLLGQTYYFMGAYQAGLKDLEKAFALDQTAEPYALWLAKAHYYSQDFLQCIESIKNTSLQGEAQYFDFLCKLAAGEVDAANIVIEQALGTNETEPYKSLFAVAAMSSQNDVSLAYNKVKQLQQEFPEHDEVLRLYANLAARNQDWPAAINAYQQLNKARPKDLMLKLTLATVYLQGKEYNQALNAADVLLKQFPNQAYVNGLKAEASFALEQFEAAKLHAEKAIQNGSKTYKTELVAALANYQLGKYEQSYQYFSGLSANYTLSDQLSRLYTVVQLRLGYALQAADALQADTNVDEMDSKLMVEAGLQALKLGNTEVAAKLATKANQLKPTNAQELVRLGVLNYALDENTDMLEEALKLDEKLTVGKMALASAYFQSGEYEKSLELAETWLQQDNKDIVALNLAALSLFKLNKNDKAEVYLQDSLKVKPGNPIALIYFSNVKLNSATPADAKPYLDAIVKHNPDYIEGYLHYYSGYKKLGMAQKALDDVKKLYRQDATNINKALMYARVLVNEQDAKQALEILNKVAKKDTNPAIYWGMLGDTYVQLQKFEDAINTYKDWARINNGNPLPWVKQIFVHQLTNKWGEGLVVAQNALKQFTNNSQLQLLEVDLLLKTQKVDLVDAKLKTLESSITNSELVRLRGEYWLQKGDVNKGLDALVKYYDTTPSYRAATLIYTASKTQNVKKAYQFLQTHLNKHPQDLTNTLLFANENLISNKDLSIELYLKVLAKEPQHLVSLNNLAWLYGEQNNLTNALEYGEKALKLSPNSPAVMDTVALIKLKNNDLVAAEQLSAKAYTASDKNLDVGFTYLQILKAKADESAATNLENELVTNAKAKLSEQAYELFLRKLDSVK